MSDYCITFISQENFEKHVAETIKSYNETLKSINLAKFNSNIIDPIKLTFDKSLFKKSMEEILELEIHVFVRFVIMQNFIIIDIFTRLIIAVRTVFQITRNPFHEIDLTTHRRSE